MLALLVDGLWIQVRVFEDTIVVRVRREDDPGLIDLKAVLWWVGVMVALGVGGLAMGALERRRKKSA